MIRFIIQAVVTMAGLWLSAQIVPGVDFTNNGATNHPKNGDLFRIRICGEPTYLSSGANTVGCSFGGHISPTVTSYQLEIDGDNSGGSIMDVTPRGTLTGNTHSIGTP